MTRLSAIVLLLLSTVAYGQTTQISNLTATWNKGATTFNAIKMDITDTASAAGSSALWLGFAGTPVFNVDKDGTIYASSVAMPTISSIATLTNKTIVAANNTLTLFAGGANNQLLTDDGSGGLVSESGLFFDGTDFGIGTSTPGFAVHLTRPTSGNTAFMMVEGNVEVGAYLFRDTRAGGETGALSAGGSACLFMFSDTGSFAIHTAPAATVLTDPASGTRLLDMASDGDTQFIGANTTFNVRVTQSATGDIRAGNAIHSSGTNENMTLMPDTGGTAGATVMGAAWNGSAWRSLWEYANVGSGEPDLVMVKSGGNVGVHVTVPLEVLQVDDAIAISSAAEGSVGRLTRRTTHETHTLAAAGTSDTTTISIPTNCKLLAVSFTVNTAVEDDGGDDTWSAAFVTGSTQTLATAAAAAQNTKVDTFHPIYEISSGISEIRFTANGGSFTAGVIEVVSYFEELTSLAN